MTALGLLKHRTRRGAVCRGRCVSSIGRPKCKLSSIRAQSQVEPGFLVKIFSATRTAESRLRTALNRFAARQIA